MTKGDQPKEGIQAVPPPVKVGISPDMALIVDQITASAAPVENTSADSESK